MPSHLTPPWANDLSLAQQQEGCAAQQNCAANVRVGSFTSLWLLRSTVRMSASHPKATEFAAQQRNDAQCRYLRARSGKILLQQYLPTPDLDCGAPNGARGDVSWRLTMRRAYQRGRSNPSR